MACADIQAEGPRAAARVSSTFSTPPPPRIDEGDAGLKWLSRRRRSGRAMHPCGAVPVHFLYFGCGQRRAVRPSHRPHPVVSMAVGRPSLHVSPHQGPAHFRRRRSVGPLGLRRRNLRRAILLGEGRSGERRGGNENKYDLAHGGFSKSKRIRPRPAGPRIALNQSSPSADGRAQPPIGLTKTEGLGETRMQRERPGSSPRPMTRPWTARGRRLRGALWFPNVGRVGAGGRARTDTPFGTGF